MDDIGYFREIIRQLSFKSMRGNSKSIFVTGTSNGGGMSMRMACELDGVKAIAPHVGFLGLKDLSPSKYELC